MKSWIKNSSLFVIALLLGVPGLVSGQAVKVEARLDTTTILIGDQTGLSLSFTGPSSARVEWPNLPDTINQGIQIIGRGKLDSVFSKDKKTLTLTQQFTVTSFDTGFYGIPQIPVYYSLPPSRDTVREVSGMLFLKVQTVPVDTTKAIKPIKGPMQVPLTFREILPWILLGLAVLALVAAAVWYWRRRKAHKPIIDLIPRAQLTPHEAALKELEELRGQKLWQAGKVKEYYTGVTDVLRKYIEARYAVPAMESTTDEIIEGLRKDGQTGDAAIRLLQPVLVLADFVKFAKAKPVASENEEEMDKAIEFIRVTIPENKN